MGSRSADLDKGLPSPLLCAPARWPAHLLGCSARLASPRLDACRLSTCAPARHMLGIWHLPGTSCWHLRGIACFGVPLARCGAPTPPLACCYLLSGLACISQLHALVLVRLLGAPPTGAPDSALSECTSYWGHPLSESNGGVGSGGAWGSDL
jgi:hypothetical protein